MPAARRLELHRTIGRVLEDMYGGDLESHLAELAHHFTEAAPLGLAKEAVEYSVRAGDRAAAALAYENAAQHYGPLCSCSPCWSTPALSGAVRSCSPSATPTVESRRHARGP
jgi:hypothetical protein